MTRRYSSRSGRLGLLAAVACWWAATASAQVQVTPEGTFSHSTSARGTLDDRYNFSIADDSGLSFSALASFGPSNRFWINDFAATLSRNGELIDTAQHRELPLFSWEELEFAPRTLGPGDYSLHLTGVVGGVSDVPITSYQITMQFAAAVPIPEPATFGLMAAGLLLLGTLTRRRARCMAAS